MLEAADWPTVSALFDQALDLARDKRERWLEALPAEYDRLKPTLAQLLKNYASIETEDFLQRLPELEIPSEHERSASEPVHESTLVHCDGAEAQDFAPAKTIVGSYRILRLLGRGGMGSVWLAERVDGLVKRAVALKLPHVEQGDTRLAERLARERDILAALAHPHIARLYDAGLADGQPYLALEYVEGVAIGVHCDEKKLSVRQRVKLFLQVIQAVQYAHSRLVIHRDLKPSNLLVGPDGQVHLLDFGIAKLIVEGQAKETELTQLGGRALTPNYASPEQIMGLPIATASDVYSLGVILYELVTGTLPYRLKRDSRGALEDAILAADPARPSTLTFGDAVVRARGTTPKKIAAALRGDLDTILLKALKKQPEQRYATAEAFGEDIERYLHGDAVQAQPDSTWYRTRKLVLRNPVVSASVAGAFLALAIGLTIAISQAERAREQARIAEKEASTAKAIQAMLEDIFRTNTADQPDPLKAQQTTARELLDIGAKKLETSLQDQPAVRIEMLGTLVTMYKDLDLDSKAFPLARERVQLVRKLYGENHPAFAQALFERSYLLYEPTAETDFKKAEAILDGVKDYSSQLRGHLEAWEAQYYLFTDMARVKPHVDRAVEILRAYPPSQELVYALSVKADYEDRQRNPTKAESLAQEAIAIAEGLDGRANSMLPPLYGQLAAARESQNDIKATLAAFEEYYQIAAKLEGIDGSDAIDAGKNLGDRLCRYSRMRDGVTVLDRTSEVAAALVAKGRTSPPSLVLASDGRCWAELGGTEKALDQFRQIAEWRKRADPQAMVDYQVLSAQLETLTEIGAFRDAKAALDRVAELSPKLFPLDNNLVRRRITYLMSTGQYEEARKIVADYRIPESEPSTSIFNLERRLTLAGLELAGGNFAAAATMSSEIASDLASSADRPYLAKYEVRAALLTGIALHLAGHPDQAVPSLQHAVELATDLYDKKRSVKLAETQIALAQCYLDLKNRDEARRLFLQAKGIHATQKKIGPQYAEPLRVLAERLRTT